MKNIRILTSAMGLGTYIPALHITEYLKEQGYHSQLQVFEESLDESSLDKYHKTKEMFQSSYKAALLGHKLAEQKLNFMLEDNIVDTILQQWEDEGIDAFILLSGNWTRVVSLYKERFPKVKGIIVHMDIGVAPSWKKFQDQNLFTEVWPIDEKQVNYLVDQHYDQVVELNATRGQRLFLHGGGWGMGTYLSKLEDILQNTQFSVLTTINNKKDYKSHDRVTYYMMDNNWKPWKKNEEGYHYYPPMSLVEDDKVTNLNNNYSNGLYSLYHSCLGILSKPGGGTLMDSLITETPIIFLEPIAEHEKVNQEVWVRLQFGMPYDQWIQSDDPLKDLQRMKENIKQCKLHTPSLGERLIKELLKDETA